jgi:CheY-like chemotaxis protein
MNITRNLIKLMHGKLFIESEPGKGSAFTVRLPQKIVNPAVLSRELIENIKQFNLTLTAQRKETLVTREFMPYGSVLIVDDVEMNLYVATGLLTPYGLSVDTAMSGFEAIDKIEIGKTYDIIFMDHMMPKMDGIETTRKIRELGYALPIVALTANALAGQAEIFLGKGFDGFISKPIDIRQLNVILNRLIRDKQPPEALEAARQQKQKSNPPGDKFDDPKLAAIFVRDAEKAVYGLEAICQNTRRDDDDVSLFTTYVHGMKSALASIGETALSLTARKLEQAGRQQDIESVASEVPAFLGALRKVIAKMKPKDEEKHSTAVDAITEADRVYVREKFLAIQAACTALNKRDAKALVSELAKKTWPRPIQEKLDKISENLLHSEFKEAADIAGSETIS